MPATKRKHSNNEGTSTGTKGRKAATEPPTKKPNLKKSSKVAENDTDNEAAANSEPRRRTTRASAKTAEGKTNEPKIEVASKKSAIKATNKSGDSKETLKLNTAVKKSAAKAPKSDQIERADGEECYWLMKAEPESRLEKGVDVKFSIDDLAARDEPEAWDGVRNPMGIMQIVHEQTPDESAFDPKHPYYDPKSNRDQPRWCVVHVRFVLKFDALVPLKTLQEHAGQGGPLQSLQTLKMSRLSVSRVMPGEWDAVLDLAGVGNKDVEEALAKLGPY